MPLYDFECKKCKHQFEIFGCIKDLKMLQSKKRCPICRGRIRQVITKANRDWFRPHINEDFDGTPIQVTSKEHYKELCKKYGVQARCLL